MDSLYSTIDAYFATQSKELVANDNEPPAYVDALFPAQRRAFDDPSRRKAYLCTRRSGKTHELAVELLSTALANPHGTSLYIATRRSQARRALGGALSRLKRAYPALEWRERNIDGQLMYELPNEHRIWAAGCLNLAETEKFRADYYHKVVIDECASYADDVLSALVDDVISPALLDTNGQLILAGTPGVLPVGFFYEVTTGAGDRPQWPTHRWSVRDNPHIPDFESWIAAEMATNGWTLDSPTYLREWMGQWVKDEDALIYRYNAAKHAYHHDPLAGHSQQVVNLVLGVDLGQVDHTAFVLSASIRGLPDVWILSASSSPNMTTSQRAAEILRIRKQYSQYHVRVMIDEGGLGKGIAEDLRRDYGIGCEAASKTQKGAAIQRVRDWLAKGSLYLDPRHCQPLIAEWSALPWNDKRMDHHPDYQDDCSDAALYSLRGHYTWDARPAVAPPLPGTPEAIDAEMERYKRREAEAIRARNQGGTARQRNQRVAAAWRR